LALSAAENRLDGFLADGTIHKAVNLLGLPEAIHPHDLGNMTNGLWPDYDLCLSVHCVNSERMIEQSPGVTRLLDRLEAKGLVRRERCPHDRRQVLCWIQPAGLLVLQQLEEPLAAFELSALAPLGEARLLALIETLDLLQEMLGDYQGTLILVSHDPDDLDDDELDTDSPLIDPMDDEEAM
jgi:hypothetical protein